MTRKKISRREMLKGLGLGLGSAVLASCAPQIVKETVVVEKVVEKPVEKIVKETVIVQGTPQVVEKIVTVTPVAEEIILTVHKQSGREVKHRPFRYEYFKDKFPNVTVVEDPSQPSAEDEIRWLARLAAGTIADDVKMGDENPSFYGPRGILIDLAPRIEAEKDYWLDDEIFYQEAFCVEPYGARYSVPTTDGPWQVLLNLQNFEDLGVEVPPFLYSDPDYDAKWSWEGFKETARQLTVDANGRHPGDAGFDKDNVEKYGFGFDINWQQLWPFIYQAGGKVVDDKWTKALFDSPESLKALNFLNDMIQEGICVTPGLASTMGGARSLVVDGFLGMHINGGYTYGSFLDLVQAGELRLSYAPLPHDVTVGTLELGVQHGIPTLCKHPDIAWAWIKSFFETFDAAIESFEEWGHNPKVLGCPLKKKWNEFLNSGKAHVLQSYGKDKIDLRPLYEDSLSAAISPMPYGPFFPEVRDIFYSEIAPAFSGDVTVEEAVAAMMPATQEVMDRVAEILSTIS